MAASFNISEVAQPCKGDSILRESHFFVIFASCEKSRFHIARFAHVGFQRGIFNEHPFLWW